MTAVLWVVVAAAAAAVVVVVVARARRRQEDERGARSAAPRTDPLAPDRRTVGVRDLGVGAVVSYGGRDFVVRGTLAFDQDGFTWQEHLLDDADIRRWLSVEEDEELEVVLWEQASAAGLTPGEPWVERGDVRYELDEHGEATFRAEGTTGTAPTGRVEYWDYAAGDQRLSFERYGSGGWEVGVGTRVPDAGLDVYPAGDLP